MLLTIQNGLAEAATIHLGKDKIANFQFVVIDPRGVRHTIAPLRTGGMGQVGRVVVPAGAKYKQELVLNQWFEFPAPGTYSVEAELEESLSAHPDRPTYTWSSRLMRLRVQPRDPVRLAEVCAKLLHLALASPNYADAYPAAVALSYVRDPVALPYLGELLAANNMLSGEAIAGLVRIGTPEAVRILKLNQNTPNPLLKSGIEGALREIKTGIRPEVAD